MNKSNEVYVSLDKEEYKGSRTGLLSSQIDLLNSLKNLQRLTKIRLEKAQLKIMIRDLILSIFQDIAKLESKLPKPTIPKTIQRELTASHMKVRIKRDNTKTELKSDSIEQELLSIKEKLKKINNL